MKPKTVSSLTLLATCVSLVASVIIFIGEKLMLLIPEHLRYHVSTTLNYHDLTLIILQGGFPLNQVYEAAEVYLPTLDLISPSTRCIQVNKTPRQETIKLAIANGEQAFDTFEDINLKWRYVVEESPFGDVTRRFELTFDKKHKEKVMTSYFTYVLDRVKAIKEEQKILKLRNVHSSTVDLEHPATFKTIAMEPDLKRKVIKDLDRFVRRREFYKKVGKAWKRGYLLYGPPGTGKSSLIAAMANHLKFDVYELELSRIRNDSHLKSVLLSTTNRSILVIEDIDCSVDMQNRKSEQSDPNSCETGFTLSGLLNFMDGLWSSCGDERIIVFTTNHKDRLDPALLRPGRMDMHIHMSYCTPNAFKVLASNYLGIHDIDHHRLYEEVVGLLESTSVTPAEVCEELMKSDADRDDDDADVNVDADVALEGLVNFLNLKMLGGTTNERDDGENSIIIN